jgi:hypothetical protein
MMVDATPAIRFEDQITVNAAAQFLGVSPSLVYVVVRRPKLAKYFAKRRSAFRRRPELIGHDRPPENLASLLASFDERRTTTRKTINGTQKRVLHLKTTTLFPDSGQTGHQGSDSISN